MFHGFYSACFQSLGLYSIGIVLGFLLVPFVVRKQLTSEQEGIELDQDYDKLFLAYKFVDEVDEAPQSTLTEEELEGLRDKVLHYEIPYIDQKVILFYDHKKGGFAYYANHGIIYKYLNVAARKYVLDYGCKQVFKEMVPSIKKEEKAVTSSQFVVKAGKTLLEKDMNAYYYLGSFQDFDKIKNPVEHKKIDFMEYMKQMDMKKMESEPAPETLPESAPEPLEMEPEPEKTSRVLDFLRQFSSTPKSQSIKID
jgi:hypothetical protein